MVSHGDSIGTSCRDGLSEIVDIEAPVCGLFEVIRNEIAAEKSYRRRVERVLRDRNQNLAGKKERDLIKQKYTKS